MKIKNLFSLSLFIDTIYRLRALIIFAAIFFPFSLSSTPITLLMTVMSTDGLIGMSQITLMTQEMFDLSGVSMLLAPIMMFTAFSFLYKRSTADFFEHLPYTRRQMVFSSLVAVLVSVVAVITLSMLVSTLLLIPTTSAGYLRYDYLSAIPYALAHLLVAIYTMSVALLAVSVTGTAFRSAVVALSIVAVPRLIMSCVCAILETLSQTLIPGHSLPIFNNEYNLCTALVANNYSVLQSPVAFIYTAILSAAVLALGLWLYIRRPSETATRPFTSRLVFEIVRISASTLLYLLAIFLFVSGLGLSFLAVFIVIGTALANVLAGYPKERFVVMIKRGAISLGISIGTVAVIFLSILLGSSVANSYAPTPEEIESVSPVRELPSYQNYINYLELVNLRTSDIEIEDLEVRTLVSRAIARGVPNNYFDYEAVSVRINSGIVARYRTVYMTSDECDVFYAAVIEGEGFKENLLDIGRDAYSPYIFVGGYEMDSAYANEIFEKYQDEATRLGFEAYYGLHMSGASDALLCYSVKHQGTTFTVNLPIFEEMTETYALYTKYAKEIEERQYRSLMSLLDTIGSSGDNYFLSLSYYGEDEFCDAYIELMAGDPNRGEICGKIKEFVTSEISYDKFGTLAVSLWSDTADEEIYISLVTSDNVTEEEILSFLKKYGY